MYALEGERFQEGDIFQKPGDEATSLYLLSSGFIDVYTSFEGYNFSLQKLVRGSVLNYRTFFMENQGRVYISFPKESILQVLPYSKMEKLCDKHKMLS